MMNALPKQIRVLGIAPSSRGFGFAVMAGESTLVAWGVKSVKGGKKNERSLSNAANLVAHYKPDVIALEGTQGSRRGPRVQALIEEIIEMAKGENIDVMQFSRAQVNLAILKNDQGTKHALAEQVAASFPDELSFRLPQKRRVWVSEAYQMDIFEAVALAQCFVKSAHAATDLKKAFGRIV